MLGATCERVSIVWRGLAAGLLPARLLAVQKWRDQFLNPKLGAGRRQQLIVALARSFGVD